MLKRITKKENYDDDVHFYSKGEKCPVEESIQQEHLTCDSRLIKMDSVTTS